MKLFLNLRRWFSPAAMTLTCAILGACAGSRVTPEGRELFVVGTEYAFDAPGEIESGVVTVRLVNEGATELHTAALIRLTSGHTLDDFSEWMRDSLNSPSWAVHVGGVESIPPGAEAEAIVVLAPGPHLIVCYHGEGQGRPHHALGMIALLDVINSESSDPEPEFDINLVMFDYGYAISDSLGAGYYMVRVVGAGPQVHNVLIWRLAEGKTADDLTRWLESDRTAVRPARPMGGLTALSPGEHAYLPIQLDPGRYVLVCLVPDIEDARFHLSHGMMREIFVP
jgi:hypothetical protein